MPSFEGLKFAQEPGGATYVCPVWTFQGQARAGWRKQSRGTEGGGTGWKGKETGPQHWYVVAFVSQDLGFTFPSPLQKYVSGQECGNISKHTASHT
jgi:hypothetical protein